MTPLTYTNLGSGTPGTGIIIVRRRRCRHLKYAGHDAGDTYTVAATTGVITSTGTPGTYIPVTPILGGSSSISLNLIAPGVRSMFTLNALSPLSLHAIVGNADPRPGRRDLNGNGTAVNVT